MLQVFFVSLFLKKKCQKILCEHIRKSLYTGMIQTILQHSHCIIVIW